MIALNRPNVIQPDFNLFPPLPNFYNSFATTTPVVAEQKQWAKILSAFEKGEYASKNDIYVPSLYELLMLLPVAKGTALDVGCGFGLAGKILKQYGWDVHGTDILDVCLEHTNRFFPARYGDICNIPFKNGSFDLTTCSMVLMLVNDIYKACHELLRVTKNNGHVIISILNPNFRKIGVLDSNVTNRDIAHWNFEIADSIETITYFDRSLFYYDHYFKAVFGEIDYFTINTRGSINLIDINKPIYDSEYLYCIRGNLI